MTFDPFRDMRDAVPTDPPPAVERQRAAPWVGVVFAAATVMLVVAGWYLLGSTMGPSMRAENPPPTGGSQTR